MWLIDITPELVQEKLRQSSRGIKVDQFFLSQFYDWARVQLSNEYTQVRMSAEELCDPVPPPRNTAYLFLCVRSFGIKMEYNIYHSLISSSIVPTQYRDICIMCTYWTQLSS